MMQVSSWKMIQGRVKKPVHTMQMLTERVTGENWEYSLTVYTYNYTALNGITFLQITKSNHL